MWLDQRWGQCFSFLLLSLKFSLSPNFISFWEFNTVYLISFTHSSKFSQVQSFPYLCNFMFFFSFLILSSSAYFSYILLGHSQTSYGLHLIDNELSPLRTAELPIAAHPFNLYFWWTNLINLGFRMSIYFRSIWWLSTSFKDKNNLKLMKVFKN